MKFATLILVVVLSTSSLPLEALRNHRSPTSGRKPTVARASVGKKQPRGQRAIDPRRAAQIQQALIQQGYLKQAPTARWDEATEVAMLQFQRDNGWQTKLTPDARALIKLGLGPKE